MTQETISFSLPNNSRVKKKGGGIGGVGKHNLLTLKDVGILNKNNFKLQLTGINKPNSPTTQSPRFISTRRCSEQSQREGVNLQSIDDIEKDIATPAVVIADESVPDSGRWILDRDDKSHLDVDDMNIQNQTQRDNRNRETKLGQVVHFSD